MKLNDARRQAVHELDTSDIKLLMHCYNHFDEVVKSLAEVLSLLQDQPIGVELNGEDAMQSIYDKHQRVLDNATEVE